MDKYSFSSRAKSDHMLRDMEKHHNYLEKNAYYLQARQKKPFSSSILNCWKIFCDFPWDRTLQTQEEGDTLFDLAYECWTEIF